MNTELLKIICCPQTHQPLAEAPLSLIEKLNARIAAGTLKNKSGQAVTEPLDGGLVRADGKSIYPIRAGLPLLLIDEAIDLEDEGGLESS